jgi:hypothetical protein
MAHRWSNWAKSRLRLAVNMLCFQRHSRSQRISTFVFYNIPALPATFQQWSFVFLHIPASFVQSFEVGPSFGGPLRSADLVVFQAVSYKSKPPVAGRTPRRYAPPTFMRPRPPVQLQHSVLAYVFLFVKKQGVRALASSARHGRRRSPSFPRKRQSSTWTGRSWEFAGWIPAFAGMTCGPQPPCIAALRRAGFPAILSCFN